MTKSRLEELQSRRASLTIRLKNMSSETLSYERLWDERVDVTGSTYPTFKTTSK